jgi:hypothetical protein
MTAAVSFLPQKQVFDSVAAMRPNVVVMAVGVMAVVVMTVVVMTGTDSEGEVR